MNTPTRFTFHHNVCVMYKSMHILIHTIIRVALKHNVNTVDVVHPTKIYLPPQGLVRTVSAYFFCSCARCYVSVYSVICFIHVKRSSSCWWLSGILLVWQIICYDVLWLLVCIPRCIQQISKDQMTIYQEAEQKAYNWWYFMNL